MSEAKLIPEGKYIGRIADYSIAQKIESTEPVLQVLFEFDVPQIGKRRLTLFKYFKGNATKYTLEFLATVGLRGNDPSVLIDNHMGSGCLDEEGEFEIEVLQEFYDGKQRNKIGWVNRPGGMGIAKVGQGQAAGLKQRLGDLRGAMLQARKEKGVGEPAPKPEAAPASTAAADPSTDDCPF